MARNKYPEQTVQKILTVSYRLFMEKGYEQTSIQDIVNALGMSKGAIYHHFKTKADILDRIGDEFYKQDDWFSKILDEPLCALEKLRALFLYQLGNEEKKQIDGMMLPLFKNPRLVMNNMYATLSVVAPQLKSLLEEGNQDGSVHCSQPKEAAEVMLLLCNLWVNPAILPIEKKDYEGKIKFLQNMLDALGIPLVNEEFVAVALNYYDMILSHLKKDA